MKKPWSITTTLRNPERLRDFLLVLQEIEGQEWNYENQKRYQILLIQNRVYGYGETQFYNGLTRTQIDLIEDVSQPISFEQAEEIFNSKNYEDPPMRGRQSMNPLKKLGLVAIKNGKIHTTSLGELLVKRDYDLGEMFFRSFLKWQIPNPGSRDYSYAQGDDIKPFIGIMHLINQVNKKMISLGVESKGISKEEFSIFGPTLVNYEDIERYADTIMDLRQKTNGKTKQQKKEIIDRFKKEFAQEFLQSDNEEEVLKLVKNMSEYGDNALRYFRLTRYLFIRGGGFYIDLEPRRSVEIESLLESDDASSIEFESADKYLEYISDINEPKLPWETKENYVEIIGKLYEEVEEYERRLNIEPLAMVDYYQYNDEQLKMLIQQLRDYRRDLQNEEAHKESQSLDNIRGYITSLQNIFKAEDKPITLEKMTSLGLNALNDALKIQPNYPVGDDNEPTFTAPANIPDIECFYEDFNAICEVTMLVGRDQWYNEGQPVMRHLRDFEDNNRDKEAYCLFIAPRLHRDTINTFWMAIKYEYEGKPQKIIPFSINNFVELLKILIEIKQQGKFLKHSELLELYDEILANSRKHNDPGDWIENIPTVMNSWKQTFNA